MRKTWGAAIAVLMLLSGLLLPGVAAAHGVGASTEVSLAQSIGGTELTVIARRTPQVPGPLRVDVIAHRPVRQLDLRLALDGQRRTLVITEPGMRSTTLRVAAPGRHELVLQAGAERAVLPLRVLTPHIARWELVAYGGFALAGLALAGALIAGVSLLGGTVPAGPDPDGGFTVTAALPVREPA
jgi:hypothetical protein